MASKDVLVFCMRPGDNAIGAGGTLARYAKESHRVHTIIFSYGENTNPLLKKKTFKRQKEKEANAADKILKGKGVRFLSVRYGKMSAAAEDPKFRRKLKFLINKHKPGKIFTHSIGGHNNENKTAAKLVLKIVEEVSPETDVYAFETWSNLANHPKLVVDITDFLDKKVQALMCFEGKSKRRLGVYAKAVYHGFMNDKRLAEVFKREH